MNRTIEIRMANKILDMVEKNELKPYWTMDEKFALECILEVEFNKVFVHEVMVEMTIASS